MNVLLSQLAIHTFLHYFSFFLTETSRRLKEVSERVGAFAKY
jgi:hypothetical protein